MMSHVQTLVVGGGLRGLFAALSRRNRDGDGSVRCIEAQPWPGDDVRTQRSNGFVCEIGPFAFAHAPLQRLLAPLPNPPKLVRAQTDEGLVFDGARCRPTAVTPAPYSFATGCEELVQAYRRALGDALLLGRAVTRIEPTEPGFAIVLGGEVETRIRADEVVLAVSPLAAAGLLGLFDPELTSLHALAEHESRAFVWLGGLRQDAPELTGYGLLPGPEVDMTTREFLFCDRVFPNRALPDRCLVRAELALAAPSATDEELVAIAEEELRHSTGTRAGFGFHKVHRFTTVAPDGVFAECQARVDDLVAQVGGLSSAG